MAIYYHFKSLKVLPHAHIDCHTTKIGSQKNSMPTNNIPIYNEINKQRDLIWIKTNLGGVTG